MSILLKDLGINQKDFIIACNKAKHNKEQWKIVRQIMLIENFDHFKQIMVKRNIMISKKALSLML